jgi:hypothetical protein
MWGQPPPGCPVERSSTLGTADGKKHDCAAAGTLANAFSTVEERPFEGRVVNPKIDRALAPVV